MVISDERLDDVIVEMRSVAESLEELRKLRTMLRRLPTDKNGRVIYFGGIATIGGETGPISEIRKVGDTCLVGIRMTGGAGIACRANQVEMEFEPGAWVNAETGRSVNSILKEMKREATDLSGEPVQQWRRLRPQGQAKQDG